LLELQGKSPSKYNNPGDIITFTHYTCMYIQAKIAFMFQSVNTFKLEICIQMNF